MQKLNIPKTIHVGFQNRTDTYTGKLAYVIYTDEKGKKRKETSWQSWRSDKIEPEDFDNEPTSGFVLNKGVGGGCRGWDSRNEYIRVYDPRGFEFEVSVANLLFILAECNAYKGKGIEGEFVYAWDGTELILLPVSCADYKESSKFTALQSMKITKSDMKEGLTYQHKDTRQLVYMGRHKRREFDKYSGQLGYVAHPLLEAPTRPAHVFYDVEKEDWHFEKGFTKLAKIVNEEQHPDFANLHTKFMGSKYVCEFGSVILSPITVDQVTQRSGYWFYIKTAKGYQLAQWSNWGRHYSTKHPEMTNEHFWPLYPTVVDGVDKDSLRQDWGSSYHGDDRYACSKSYLEGKELFTPEIRLKSNQTVEVRHYVERR